MKADRFLDGRTISLSVSDSPDLARLGLGGAHLRDALLELARHLIAQGATLIYGGDLRQGGFTERLFQLAHRHASDVTKPVLINPLPWPVHSAMGWSDLETRAKAVAPAAAMEFLDLQGAAMPTDRRAAEPPAGAIGAADWETGLTAMRRAVAARADAAVLLGGQVDGCKGRMPGVAEEALEAMKAGNPLYLAGGFGGAAGAVCTALGLIDPGQATQASWDTGPDFTGRTEADLNSGLDHDELRQLAASRNTDEIVALVLRGLRHRFAAQETGR